MGTTVGEGADGEGTEGAAAGRGRHTPGWSIGTRGSVRCGGWLFLVAVVVGRVVALFPRLVVVVVMVVVVGRMVTRLAGVVVMVVVIVIVSVVVVGLTSPDRFPQCHSANDSDSQQNQAANQHPDVKPG